MAVRLLLVLLPIIWQKTVRNQALFVKSDTDAMVLNSTGFVL